MYLLVNYWWPLTSDRTRKGSRPSGNLLTPPCSPGLGPLAYISPVRFVSFTYSTLDFGWNHFDCIATSPTATLFCRFPQIVCLSLQGQMQVFFTIWSVSSAVWSHRTNLSWPKRNVLRSRQSFSRSKVSRAVSLSRDMCDLSSNWGASLHEIYCTVLEIVTTMINLLGSHGRAMLNFSNGRSRSPLWNKREHRCFVQWRKWHESGKTCKRFRYPEKNVAYTTS